MAFFSLRTKILVALLTVTSLFAVFMVVFAETVIRSRLRGMLEEKGAAIARKVAADCVSPVITERYFEVALMFKDLQGAEDGILYAFVLGEDGRELVHTFPHGVPPELARANPANPLQPFTAREIATDKGPVLDIGVPLLRGQAGVLHLGLSETAIQRDVNRIVLLILLFAAITLGVGCAVAVAFSRVVTRPLVRLAGAAEAFGRGETNEPVVVETDDEIGELASIFNMMIENRNRIAREREELIGQLQKTLSEVKTLRGFLPICSSCKKVRGDQGYWQQIESYLREHTETEFSHSLCPECAQRLYPEQWDRIQKKPGP